MNNDFTLPPIPEPTPEGFVAIDGPVLYAAKPKVKAKDDEANLRTKIIAFARTSQDSLKNFVSLNEKAKTPSRLYFFNPKFEEGRCEDYETVPETAPGTSNEVNEPVKPTEIETGSLTSKKTSLITSVIVEGLNSARKRRLIDGQLQDGVGAMHAPVIDFDIPIMVVPSSQMGHHHLYIDKAITWASYKRILNALASAGLVEQSYVDHSIRRGFTALRSIGTVKKSQPKNITDVLSENAILKSELEVSKRMLDYQTQTIAPLRDEVATLKKIKARDTRDMLQQSMKMQELNEHIDLLKKSINTLKQKSTTSASSSVQMTWD